MTGLSGETYLYGFSHGIKLRSRVQLGEDRPDMRSYRGVADVQLLGNGPVVGTVDHQREYLSFPRSQAGQQLRVPGLLARDLGAFREGSGDRTGRDQGLTSRGSAH